MGMWVSVGASGDASRTWQALVGLIFFWACLRLVAMAFFGRFVGSFFCYFLLHPIAVGYMLPYCDLKNSLEAWVERKVKRPKSQVTPMDRLEAGRKNKPKRKQGWKKLQQTFCCMVNSLPSLTLLYSFAYHLSVQQNPAEVKPTEGARSKTPTSHRRVEKK